MKVMPLQQREITSSRLVLGCMGFGGGWDHNPITKEDIVVAEKSCRRCTLFGN